MSDYFWKLRCRKSVCYCGAKYISKLNFGGLDVEKVTSLWREVYFELKSVKNEAFEPFLT